MEKPLMRGVERGRPFPLAAVVEPRPGQVASMTFWRSDADSVTLFAFDAGEGISREVLEEDRLYLVLEGDMVFDADGKRGELRAGGCLRVAAGTPHSLDSSTPARALVITVG